MKSDTFGVWEHQPDLLSGGIRALYLNGVSGPTSQQLVAGEPSRVSMSCSVTYNLSICRLDWAPTSDSSSELNTTDEMVPGIENTLNLVQSMSVDTTLRVFRCFCVWAKIILAFGFFIFSSKRASYCHLIRFNHQFSFFWHTFLCLSLSIDVAFLLPVATFFFRTVMELLCYFSTATLNINISTPFPNIWTCTFTSDFTNHDVTQNN